MNGLKNGFRQNTLAKNITAAGEKAAYDAACKWLFQHIKKEAKGDFISDNFPFADTYFWNCKKYVNKN